MKTAKEWFQEYAISHQNETNKTIHFICVPAIFFSVIGLLMSIPASFLEGRFGLYNPLLENWAAMVAVFMLLFYLRLGFWYFVNMTLFTGLAIAGNYWISQNTSLLYTSSLIFVIAWIGQFYGHKIEGKKPSFLKDLQFLLIAPLWVLEKIGRKN